MSIRLVQFTDPHLYGSESATLRGVATLPALMRTLDLAQAREWPVDAVLVTGDLVQDDVAGYKHFRRIFGELKVPVLCIPGNHDEPAALHRELRGKPFVTDGPFVETKEALGGFLFYECDSEQEALDLAARIPAVQYGGAVEVRPLV
jgi:3',5'-cyclic AMP phosphodiesterase CpdA